LANKAEVNAKMDIGQTPLSLAAFYGQKEVAELLLANKKVEVNAKDIQGATPLRLAVFKGHEDVAELLRQHGGHE
jgi:ankyrin